MQRTIELTFITASLIFLTSCAAMFTGTTSDITVQATQTWPAGTPPPSEWTVTADDVSAPLGGTLADVSKKTKEITLTATDGTSHTIELPRDFQAGFVLIDILFTPGWGLSGLLIDGATGSFYEHPGLLVFDPVSLTFVGYEDDEEEESEEDARAPQGFVSWTPTETAP